MEKPDPKRAAKVLILFKDKYLFLLRNSNDEIHPSEWDMPGGGVEKEETLEEALIREVKEETGIDISPFEPLAIKSWEGGSGTTGTDFLCIIDKKPKIKLSEEHVRAMWLDEKGVFESEELPAWIKENVKISLKICPTGR
jgi:8-oxo-dGTP diphosphatase